MPRLRLWSCFLVSLFLAAYGSDKATRLREAMTQAGSPPEDCKNLADKCNVDASGHYMEVQNQFHVVVTQHCCQLFLEQESNPGMWAGTVFKNQMLIAGETGTVHESTIEFTNGIEWVKMGGLTTTTLRNPTPTTVGKVSPCAILTTPLPTIPIQSNPCAIIRPAQIPTRAPAQIATTTGKGMTKNEIWWAVGSGVAGAIGIGAIAGGAAYIHHEVMQHSTTLPLPPKPVISRKSAVSQSPTAPNLRGRKAADEGSLLKAGKSFLIVGLGVSILVVISIGFAALAWKRSKTVAIRDVVCSREECSREAITRDEAEDPEFDDLVTDDDDMVYE